MLYGTSTYKKLGEEAGGTGLFYCSVAIRFPNFSVVNFFLCGWLEGGERVRDSTG